MYVSKDQKDWDHHIPTVLFAYCVSLSDVTGKSPFYLYGRDPCLPMDVSLLTPKDLSPLVAEHRKHIVQNLEECRRIATERIQRAQQKMKSYYDQNAQQPNFENGDRVWVFTPKTAKGLSRKLQHRWHGPYRIVQKLSPVHFRLHICNTNRAVTTTVHANRLKPVTDPDERPILPLTKYDLPDPFLPPEDLPSDSFSFDSKPPGETNTQRSVDAPFPTPPRDNDFDEPEMFSAERIVRSRIRNGKPEYLVKVSATPKNYVDLAKSFYFQKIVPQNVISVESY